MRLHTIDGIFMICENATTRANERALLAKAKEDAIAASKAKSGKCSSVPVHVGHLCEVADSIALSSLISASTLYIGYARFV